MSSEALERAAQIRLALSPDGRDDLYADDLAALDALLAEVARLEQERDDLEGELADFGESRPGRLARAEAALAVAREREQRATDLLAREKFLRDRADNGEDVIEAMTQWDDDELLTEVYEEYEKRARAALVDEPAAAEPSIRDAIHPGVAWVSTPDPAAATLAEPGHAGSGDVEPAAATSPGSASAALEAGVPFFGGGFGAGVFGVPGSANAAADEPARRKLGENDPGRYEIGVLIGPCTLAEATSLSERVSNATQGYLGAVVSLTTWREDDVAAADEPGETPCC